MVASDRHNTRPPAGPAGDDARWWLLGVRPSLGIGGGHEGYAVSMRFVGQLTRRHRRPVRAVAELTVRVSVLPTARTGA
jgi:hypothetical protein